jgi:hypothetical protein
MTSYFHDVPGAIDAISQDLCLVEDLTVKNPFQEYNYYLNSLSSIHGIPHSKLMILVEVLKCGNRMDIYKSLFKMPRCNTCSAN